MLSRSKSQDPLSHSSPSRVLTPPLGLSKAPILNEDKLFGPGFFLAVFLGVCVCFMFKYHCQIWWQQEKSNRPGNK